MRVLSAPIVCPRAYLVLLCNVAADSNVIFHDVPPDGDCLFSAVALSAALVDNQPSLARARAVRTAAARLRSEAMDLLCPNGRPDEQLILGDLPASLLIEPLGGEDGSAYCKRMRGPGQWGSTAELLALTKVLQRPIRVHTAFGVEQYGNEGSLSPLSLHFADSHYRAATERSPGPAAPSADGCSAATRLRGGAVPMTEDEAAVASVLDRLHGAASKADADAYFPCFAPGAVFLGTDSSERWPLEEFRSYATERFAKGDGWTYEVLERHVTVHNAEVAWFDERLQNAKLGECRASGVLVRNHGGGEWRVAQFNLAMAIPNDKALAVAALASQ